jgi:transposase-like protein
MDTYYMDTADIKLVSLTKRFSTEDAAIAHLEAQRWPNGPACPKCGGADPYRLTAKPASKKPRPQGSQECRVCRKEFTVKVGTTFKNTKIPLLTWVIAIYLIASSKKGMSARQLHRMLGLTDRSAWFMAHRLRWAMTQEPLAGKRGGIVEWNETYVGGGGENTDRRFKGGSPKLPVFSSETAGRGPLCQSA